MLSQKEILSHFEGVTGSGNQYKAKCPGHADKNASLSITFNKDGMFGYCFCGCTMNQILEGAGLTWADIGRQKEKQPLTWRNRMLYGFNKQNGSGWEIHDIYNYKSETGKYLYSKVRFHKKGKDKEIRYYRIDQKNDRYSAGRGGIPPILYNIDKFMQAVRDGYEVYYVEGEKDVETLAKYNMVATTAGAVKDWKPEYSRYFTGAKVTIFPDNDEVGQKLAERVKRDLRDFAYWVQIIPVSSLPKGDITDYLEKEGGTIEEVKAATSAGEAEDLRQYGSWLNVDKELVSDPETGQPITKINSIKVSCDKLARIFGRHNGNWICRRGEDERDDLFLYDYSRGVYTLCNRNACKSAIKKYMPLGTAGDRSLNEVANLLMTDSGNECSIQEIDADEDYINYLNGLYSISQKKLLPHSDKIRTTLQINARYTPEDKRKPFKDTLFSKFLDDLCRDPEGNVDRERESVLQEYAGLVLSCVNVMRTKKMLVLYSPRGDSGKSVYERILLYLLGSGRVANIPLQRMDEKNGRFALGALVNGIRLIAVGDQSGSIVEDSSVFKQLTGGDAVKIEKKHKQELYFTYHGGIIILCNLLPSVKDDKGEHLFNRFLIIPCENHFEEKDQDKDLDKKLEKEADEIAMWALEGLHRVIANRYQFSPCKAADRARREYRKQLDTVYRFIHTNGYVITKKHNDRVGKTAFEKNYISWCNQNDIKNVNKQYLRERMQGLGCWEGYGNTDIQRGISVYRGIRLKRPDEITEDDFEPMDDSPFEEDPKTEPEQLDIRNLTLEENRKKAD